MYGMDHYSIIRREVIREGKSQRAVSRELGYSRGMVSKALENALPPGYQRKKPVKRPKIDKVRHIIDAWLEEDMLRHRKQRHTAVKIHERLVEEYGFDGEVSCVRRYVASKKKTISEAFVPLHFLPGEEAQVDWGEAKYYINGVEHTMHLFCMRLCYSGASFVYPYRHQRLECFLDGHVRAFKHFGGIPRRIAYDNLKSAVLKVGKGKDRTLNHKFAELKTHYVFDARFCNIASGNEKGHVESLGEKTLLE